MTSQVATSGVVTRRSVSTTKSVKPDLGHDDPDYDLLLAKMQVRFMAMTDNGKQPVFTTGLKPAALWETYLSAIPAKHRQISNCRTCRQFIERFGGLVVINPNGTHESVLWHVIDTHGQRGTRQYTAAWQELQELVQGSEITGVFLSEQRVWGTAKVGGWSHLHVTPTSDMVYTYAPGQPNADQAMALKLEHYRMVRDALSNYSFSTVQTAVQLLRGDALYRSEKVQGPLEWFHKLHTIRRATRSAKAFRDILWTEVANAPDGFCHIKASVTGSLLEDLENSAGKSIKAATERFAAKMQPLRYQRAQAAPTEGAVRAAEKLVSTMGLEVAFPRRWARLDEVQFAWQPYGPKKAPGGPLFGHLQTKGTKSANPGRPLNVAARKMSWAKFADQVLGAPGPSPSKVEIFLATGALPLSGLTTAVDPNAPPLIMWDQPDERNPVAWYCYNRGATAHQFSMRGNAWHELAGVALKPWMWTNRAIVYNQPRGVFFLIKDAHDTGTPSGCLFPELLRGDLHGVRSVIEAYSNSARLGKPNGPPAVGWLADEGQGSQDWGLHLRVWSDDLGPVEYHLDRWD